MMMMRVAVGGNRNVSTKQSGQIHNILGILVVSITPLEISAD
jgi:hypothetical protein